MANYYGQSRTNYFAVKDPDKFLKELEEFEVEVRTHKEDGQPTLYAFMDSNQNGEGLQWERYNQETEEYEMVDWLGFLARHVADDYVAVLLEVGFEKYRYFNGEAWAVNSKGEARSISIQDIYNVAKELGTKITDASY